MITNEVDIIEHVQSLHSPDVYKKGGGEIEWFLESCHRTIL